MHSLDTTSSGSTTRCDVRATPAWRQRYVWLLPVRDAPDAISLDMPKSTKITLNVKIGQKEREGFARYFGRQVPDREIREHLEKYVIAYLYATGITKD
jgi:hypothetical protein